MLNLITKLVKDESGQDLAEYGIALAVVAVAAASIAVAMKTDITKLWSSGSQAVSAAAAG